MNSAIEFLQAHPTSSTLVAYYLASAFIGALPAPRSQASQFYLFIYKFANTLGGNLTRAFATKVEASPNWQPAIQKVVNGGLVPGLTPIPPSKGK